MTFYTTLKEGTTERGATVTAYKSMDKYSTLEQYAVTVSRGGLGIFTEKCARTTWRKKFNDLLKNSDF